MVRQGPTGRATGRGAGADWNHALSRGCQHSDQGAQYKATRVRETLVAEGITCSMSRRGNCWDNAVAEAFFATLKREHIYRTIFLTHEDAKISIAEWIGVFYNGQRRHSTIGYCSPVEYERDYYSELAASQAA